MFCMHCGAQLKDGAKFCGNCGVSTEGAPSTPTNEPTQAISSSETQAMPVSETQAFAPSDTPTTLAGEASAQQLYGMGATQVMPGVADAGANAAYQAPPSGQYQTPGAPAASGAPGGPGAPSASGGPGMPDGPIGNKPHGSGSGKIIGIIVGVVAVVVIAAIIAAVVFMNGNSSGAASKSSSSSPTSESSQVQSSASVASSSASSSAASSTASSSTASSSASSTSASSSASSASSGTSDAAADARKKAEAQGKQVLEGTLHVTTNAERAKQVDPNLKGFEKDNTQLIWLEVSPAVQVNGIYPGDTTATPKAVKAFCLNQGDKAALAKLNGQHVLIAIEPDAAKANRYWPTDLSGVLFDVAGPFEVIYAK